MAADKKSATPSEKAEVDAGAGAGDNEAKTKKKKLLLMIGIAVLLIVVSIGSTVLVLKLLTPKPTSESSSEKDSESEEHDETEGHDESDDASKDGDKEKEVAPAVYLALKPPFTVNYDVHGKQRFLQTELTILYRDTGVLSVLELHMPVVRNGLVLLLSKQSFDDLQTLEGKEKLRTEALKIVNEILLKEQKAVAAKAEKDAKKEPLVTIEQVLFTNFVMQ